MSVLATETEGSEDSGKIGKNIITTISDNCQNNIRNSGDNSKLQNGFTNSIQKFKSTKIKKLNKKNKAVFKLKQNLLAEYKLNIYSFLYHAGAKITPQDVDQLIESNIKELPNHIFSCIPIKKKRNKRKKNAASRIKHQDKVNYQTFNNLANVIKVAEPLLKCQVYNNDFYAICDTGASNCFISNKVAEVIKQNNGQIVYNEKEVQLAQGTTKILGMASFNIKWATGNHLQYFYIMPELNRDIILGRDFLKSNKINIESSTNSYYFNRNYHQLFPFDTKPVEETTECNITDIEEFNVED